MAVTLNQYDGTFAVLGKQSVVAESMQVAARVLYTTYTEDPILIQKVREGISVEMPVTQTHFVTVIEPEAAELAGAKALPETYTLPAGSSQLFSALEVTGWRFIEWRINGSQVSTANPALLNIPQSDTTLVIEAVFVVSP